MFNFVTGNRDLYMTQPVILKEGVMEQLKVPTNIKDLTKISDTDLSRLPGWYNYGQNWKFPK